MREYRKGLHGWDGIHPDGKGQYMAFGCLMPEGDVRTPCIWFWIPGERAFLSGRFRSKGYRECMSGVPDGKGRVWLDLSGLALEEEEDHGEG